MRQRWGVVVVIAVVSFLTGGWLVQRGREGSVYDQARLFEDVLAHVDRYYVDSLGEAELYERATRGLLEQLKDPYSVLLVDEEFKQLTEATTGNYGGLGIQIDVREGWITVVAPLPDTPAERAGIETGDQIIEVNGKSTEGWTNEQAVNALRGEVGSRVAITVRRVGVPAPLRFQLTRAQIHVRSVPPGTLFEDGIGYVKLSPVSETSASELRSEISAMLGKGMTAMILDLRDNPGGLLDQGVKVADLFLDPNQEIVATRGRARGSTRRFVDEARQAWPNLPIVVLVNDGSASAAEIIAGALQDHDRAVIVGTPTFGKGLVQTLYQLGPDRALKLTTARWYTPSGRTIQRIARDEEEQARLAAIAAGEAVDSLPVAPSDTSLAERPVYRTDAGRIVRGGGGIVPDIVVRDTLTPQERAFAAALGGKVPEYRDVLTAYALELKNAGTVKSPDFRVTPAMRREVLERLRRKGAQLSDSVFYGASRLIDEQLGYQIARYVFGRAAEFRRQAADDEQMRVAMELLRGADTPKELLGLASARVDAASAGKD